MNKAMVAALANDISAVVHKDNLGTTRYERMSKNRWKRIYADSFGRVKITSDNTTSESVFDALEDWVLMYKRAPDITGNRLVKTATIVAGRLGG